MVGGICATSPIELGIAEAIVARAEHAVLNLKRGIDNLGLCCRSSLIRRVITIAALRWFVPIGIL